MGKTDPTTWTITEKWMNVKYKGNHQVEKKEAEEAEANTSHDQGAKNNFESWGKRCKIDIEHVKELRDRMNAKAKPRKKTNMTKIHASWYLTILMLLYFIASTMGTTQPSGLIAYDCANPDVNMTSYSLLDVMSCMPSTRNLSVSEIPIQVLQRSAKSTAMVYQCKMIMYGSGCSSFSVRQWIKSSVYWWKIGSRS